MRVSRIDGYKVYVQGCNLRCPDCHNLSAIDPLGGFNYKPAVIRDLLEKRGKIEIMGGEPLLQEGELKKLLTMCQVSGIESTLHTNAVFLWRATYLINLASSVVIHLKPGTVLMFDHSKFGNISFVIQPSKDYIDAVLINKVKEVKLEAAHFKVINNFIKYVEDNKFDFKIV